MAMCEGVKFSVKTKWIAIVFIITIVCLQACQDVWYFSIVDSNNSQYPTLCFGRFKNCSGPGQQFSLLDIYEIDSAGQFVVAMWELEPTKNMSIKKVVYGTPPDGYKETMKAKPLELGKWYSVHDTYFFRIFRVGDRIESEVIDREGYVEKFKGWRRHSDAVK
jgi:hypothetical protein